MTGRGIKLDAGLWSLSIGPALRIWWGERRIQLMRVAIALLIACAAAKLGMDVPRLLWAPSRPNAVDLALRHREVHAWFAGQPAYRELKRAIYPPATYVMLWPFVGWLDLAPARWLWAVTALSLLACLAYFAVRGSGATTPLERTLAALLAIGMNATGMAVGNGQLTLHVLVPLIAAVFLLRREPNWWGHDLVAAFLLLFSLVKPSISVPFFALVLAWGRMGVLLLTAAGYAALTLVAAWFQPDGVLVLFSDWMKLGLAESAGFGYANLHGWLDAVGLQRWDLLASFLALAGLSAWVCRHRQADAWLLIGATALVARLWMYHQLYDDVLILLPMIVLFRIAKRAASPGARDLLAGVLLAVTTAAMLIPTRFSLAGSPWQPLFSGVHAAVWLAVLIFLLRQASLESKTSRQPCGLCPISSAQP
jgi:hypothetical protein